MPFDLFDYARNMFDYTARNLCCTWQRFRTDRSGNIAVMMGFLFPIFAGTLGLGFEVSNWYRLKHAMKNAADAATIAAATNGGSNYDVEAKAVAAQYGFVNGVNNVSVVAANNATCPSGGNTCYGVTITGIMPLFLSQVVGFKGDAVVNGASGKSLSATSVAKQASASTQYCLLALGTSGATGITTNGAPKSNMAGCSLMSNNSATCHGHNLGADVGDAHGTNSGCGVKEHSNVPAVTDPYSYLASNIPTNTCSSYPQEPASKKDPALPASNQWTGTKSLSGNMIVCGDLQLSGNVTVTAPSSGAVLVIENGQLDTNGYTLQTSSGSGLTIVFSGTGGSYTHAPTGGGTLDITAPTSGPWSGVAIYQDPSLSTGVDISAAGNSPTWDITGLVYLPHSSVTFSGAVNKSSNGQSCFVLVVDNVTINGTGGILAHGGCAAAGLKTMPTGGVAGRGSLVL
jgi:Flp pilus assembly protein TadG